MENQPTPKKIDPRLWGGAVFLVALLLRAMGIGWGLPNSTRAFSYHPDESINLFAALATNPLAGNFDPGFYNYGSLYLWVHRLLLSLAGVHGEPQEWAVAHLLGRFMNVAAGAALAWLAYALLRRVTNLFGAICGGLLVAFSPALVVHSRFQTVDMLAAALLLGAMLLAVKIAQLPEAPSRLTLPIWAGALVGLSAGTKYSGAVGLVAVLLAIYFSPLPRSKAVFASVLGCLAAFVIATPGCLLNTEAFLRDVRFEMQHVREGHGLVFLNTPSGFIVHLVNLFNGIGGLACLLGLAGLIWAVGRKEKWALVLGTTFLLTFLAIGTGEVKFMRYALPLMPIVALGFGWAMGEWHTRQAGRFAVAIVPGILALGGIGGGGVATSFDYTRMMNRPDPRDDAAAYLKKEGKGRTVGLVSDPWFYTPPLYPLAGAPRTMPFPERLNAMTAAIDPRVVQFLPEDPQARQNWDMRLLDLSPDFVVFSSFEYDDVKRLMDAKFRPEDMGTEWARAEAMLERLDREYRLIKAFGMGGPMEHDLMYIQPRIWIWERKTTSRS